MKDTSKHFRSEHKTNDNGVGGRQNPTIKYMSKNCITDPYYHLLYGKTHINGPNLESLQLMCFKGNWAHTESRVSESKLRLRLRLRSFPLHTSALKMKYGVELSISLNWVLLCRTCPHLKMFYKRFNN